VVEMALIVARIERPPAILTGDLPAEAPQVLFATCLGTIRSTTPHWWSGVLFPILGDAAAEC
jgi:hypothetical protein